MKKSRFSEPEIAYAIKQAEAGTSVPEVARKYGVSEKTILEWRKRYGGLTAG
jgi:putative transposase